MILDDKERELYYKWVARAQQIRAMDVPFKKAIEAALGLAARAEYMPDKHVMLLFLSCLEGYGYAYGPARFDDVWEAFQKSNALSKQAKFPLRAALQQNHEMCIEHDSTELTAATLMLSTLETYDNDNV